jgi:hypothetical protein
VVRFDLSREPLVIQHIVKDELHSLVAVKSFTPHYYSKICRENGTSAIHKTQGIQPKSTKVMSFYQHLEDYGTYFIHFKAPVSDRDNAELIGTDLNSQEIAADRRPHVWAVSTYVEVTTP